MRAERYLIFALLFLLGACSPKGKENADFPEKELKKSEKQLSLLLDDANREGKNPRTVTADGHMHWASRDNGSFDWTLGFFPGSCWYMYEFTKEEKWKEGAIKFQNQLEKFKSFKHSHDLGFVFQCSFGNAYRLTHNKAYIDVLEEAGNSLITRFNPNVGCIQSWNVDRGWQSKRGWEFPVIIDNMMNLEMLFELSKNTGDDKYRNVAIAHANTTMKNHFREDYSSFHVIDYNPESGEVRNKHTAQGYAHESAWARGQAWGLYGYTVCYRYTKDEKYLQQAKEIANYIINYKGTPKDMIPYWDYNAPSIPKEPRDVSAAAITASALLELSEYTEGEYYADAEKILHSLASDVYTAKYGENNHFLLKHSVGSIPHNNEIDVPLNYADYYYIEALLKYKKLKSQQS